MRVRTGWLVAVVILALGCGSEGKLKRCSQTTVLQDCGAGMDCDVPRGGERGICVASGAGDCLQDCGNSAICSAAGSCKPRYLVEVAGPAGATLLGAGAQQIVVTVTRGASAVPFAASVALAVGDTALSGTPTIEHPTDTVDTYTWTYTPPSGVEQDVSFTATVTGSGKDTSTTITATSAALTLAVDTKAPTVEVVPDSGGSFAGGSDMTFQVKIADAHPPTGALQATVGTATVDLSYQGTDSGVSVYMGALTRAAMAAAGLGCSVSVVVTAEDTVGNSSTSNSTQMAFVCTGTTVCSPEATYVCQPKYTVVITSPATSALVTTTVRMQVTATVTRGTAAVAIPQVKLTTQDSTAGTSTVGTSQPTGTTGLVSTYMWYFTPPSTDTTVTFVAAAAPGTSDQVATPAVAVQVDNAGPTVVVALTNPPPSGRYLRTDTIQYTVAVTDAHPASSDPGVQVALFLSGTSTPLQMSSPGNPTTQSGRRIYTGAIDLSQYRFDFFDQNFSLSASTVDAYGHSGSSSQTLDITRLRWLPSALIGSNYDTTSPAIVPNGGPLIVGLKTTSTQDPKVLALDRATGTPLWANVALPSAVTAPPVVGAAGVWVLSGNELCLLNSSDGSIKTGTRGGGGGGYSYGGTALFCCAVGGITTGTNINISPALALVGGAETAIVGGSDGKLYQFSSGGTVPADGNCPSRYYPGAGYPIAVSPVVDNRGVVYWADQQYVYASGGGGGGGWPAGWPVNLGVGGGGGGSVAGALALDSGAVWADFISSYSSQSGLARVQLSNGAESNVSGYAAGPWPVLAGVNDVLTSQMRNSGSSNLSLARAGGGYYGSWGNPSLDGTAVGSLVLRDNNGNQTFVVPTDRGSIYQLDQNGMPLWIAQQIAGASLHEANIVTDVNDSSRRFSTAYFGSTDGHVYAVIVDGVLDTSAPWPKVRHDPQNTGNAATAIVP